VSFSEIFTCAPSISQGSALGAGALRARSIHFKTHVHVHHTEEGKPSLRVWGRVLSGPDRCSSKTLNVSKCRNLFFMLSFKRNIT
jgi:hypothetical protein